MTGNQIEKLKEKMVKLHDALATVEKKYIESKEKGSKNIAEAMKKVREDSGISLRAMSGAIGCSAPYLSDMELGKRAYSKEWCDKVITVIINNTGVKGLQ